MYYITEQEVYIMSRCEGKRVDDSLLFFFLLLVFLFCMPCSFGCCEDYNESCDSTCC